MTDKTIKTIIADIKDLASAEASKMYDKEKEEIEWKQNFEINLEVCLSAINNEFKLFQRENVTGNTYEDLERSLQEFVIIYQKTIPNQEVLEALKSNEGPRAAAYDAKTFGENFALSLHAGMETLMMQVASNFYHGHPEALMENPLPIVKTIWNFIHEHPHNSDWKPRDTLPTLVEVCQAIIGKPSNPNKVKELCDKVASQMFDEEDYNYGNGLYFRSHYDEEAEKTFNFLYNKNQNGRPRHIEGYPTISAEDQKLVDEHAEKVVSLGKNNNYYIWKDDEAEVPEAFINYRRKEWAIRTSSHQDVT